MPSSSPRVTVPQFVGLKARQTKISMVTAYDYPSARLADEAGVDGILVGDSLSMVVQGHDSTLPVTLDQMIYHAEMVGRAVRRALVVVDLPFPTNHLGPAATVEKAARVLKETRCQAVKLEGGADQAEVLRALSTAGIPVMAHVGLRPQNVHQMGGYKVQRDEQQLLADAQAAEQAGAFAVVVECVPAPLAEKLSAAIQIPTIGIGAGPHCDGQVLVLHDLLGWTDQPLPRFVKKYADLHTTISQALKRYCDEVRGGNFPDDSQSYS